MKENPRSEPFPFRARDARAEFDFHSGISSEMVVREGIGVIPQRKAAICCVYTIAGAK